MSKPKSTRPILKKTVEYATDDEDSQEEVEVSVEVDEPRPLTVKQKFKCGGAEPYSLIVLLIVMATLAVVTYHEFLIEDQNAGLKAQVEKVVKVRKFNARQLSNILSRIDPDVTEGNTEVARKACEETHCAIPCIRGRSEGFGAFLEKALETVSPIVARVPFLPKMAAQVLGPVTTLVKSIVGHPYSAASDGFCAKVIAKGVGDRNVRPTNKHLKNALKWDAQEDESIEEDSRTKREVREPPQAEPSTSELIMQLAGAYGVEPESDDEQEALHEVLVAIFRGI